METNLGTSRGFGSIHWIGAAIGESINLVKTTLIFAEMMLARRSLLILFCLTVLEAVVGRVQKNERDASTSSA